MNWQWRLILTVEDPPVEITPDPSLPVAAIDLGYRRFAGYIRFGFVVDSAGNKFELRLPDGNMISAYLKKTIEFLAIKGLEKTYIKDLKDYFVWDAAQGASLEETKKQLKKLFDADQKREIEIPEKLLKITAGLVKMRSLGLLKLRKVSNEILDGADTATCGGETKDLLKQTIEIVDKWREKDSYFETEKEHFRRKFSGRRKLLYRQTVKWLVSNFSQLVWKEDLRLREMATKAKKSSRLTNAALKESNKFRQWISLHQLRLFIKERSAKTSGWLRAGTLADRWTPVCDDCGAEIVSCSLELMIACANHEKDRDERAAAKLLKEIVTKMSNRAITVPSYLKDYIVSVQ